MTVRFLIGDALAMLKTLPSDSVHMCVTSPPYFGLRSYLPDGHQDKHLEIGREETPDAWAARLVEVFREVKRVLRSDGCCFVNIGDSYCSGTTADRKPGKGDCASWTTRSQGPRTAATGDIKPKDLVGAPWLLAFALRADGWWLRSEIIWAKPNPMPESVTDRPTKSHEQVFLLTKSERYFWDQEAVKERGEMKPQRRAAEQAPRANGHAVDAWKEPRILRDEPAPDGDGSRNVRSVWTIATEPYGEAHFATFPTELARRCILAGTSAKGVCPACGAPWARVVEREGLRDLCNGNMLADGKSDAARADPKMRTRVPSLSNSHNASTPQSPRNATLGWRATCSCVVWDYSEDGHPTMPCEPIPIPATVLDPFGGAGTTSLVAEQLDRDSIYIDLSPAYTGMARARIERAKARRFIGDADRVKPLTGQIALFD